jgi:hypothetical protein
MRSYVRTKLNVRLVTVSFIGCSVGTLTWFGVQRWPQYSPQDFEQCSDKAEKTSSSKDERMTLMAECGKQFVGRRKMGGGYTYYDFLQNRHFDIAGPNPTPKELRYFDEQYTSYLDAQRQEAVAAALAEKQNRMAQPDLQDDRVAGSISPPGLPVVIAPTNVPIPRARSSVVRSDGVCEDTSLSCNWTKFSAGIKKFFESNAEVNRP